MKLSQVLFIILLLSLSVYSAGLSSPDIREIIFEPDTEYSIKYDVYNKYSEESDVMVSADSEAPIIFEESSKRITLEPNEKLEYFLKFTTPPALPSGIYPIRFRVADVGSSAGMSAVAAVGDVIYLINPYNKGIPAGSMTFRDRYVPGEDMSFVLNVRNLGNKPINKFHSKLYLLEKGVEVLQLKGSEIISLEPYQQTNVRVKVPTEGLSKGRYAVKAVLYGDDVQIPVIKEFNLGSPELRLVSTPHLTAGKKNEIVLEVQNEWNTEIENAVFRVAAERNLLDAKSNVTLTPGLNVVKLKSEAPADKGGIVNGQIFINNEYYDIIQDIKLNVTGSSIVGAFFFGTPDPENPESSGGITTQGMVVLMLLAVIIVGVGAYFLGRRRRGDLSEKRDS